jgi:hypothetical protein
MIPLLCVAMTAAVAIYVFYLRDGDLVGENKSRLEYLRERKEAVYENLRDLNFEYKAGKVPDADYANLRATLEEEAVNLLAEIELLEREELTAMYNA